MPAQNWREYCSSLRPSWLIGLFVISACVNVLYLTGSFFMLEIYDRVIPSRSLSTLIGLCLVAVLLYLFQSFLDTLRAQVMVRFGSMLDGNLGPQVFDAIGSQAMRGGAVGDGLQPLRDLDTVRSFVSGTGPLALFDLPWIPFYVAICWAFHPLIGLCALGGACLLVGLALLSEWRGRGPAKTATGAASARLALAEATRRNAEVARALGMGGRLRSRFEERSGAHREAQQQAADVALKLAGVSKMARMMLQSAVLAIGAWLVIEQQATGGVIIAASILSARALAPAELAIANWRGFLGARQAWMRLSDVLAKAPSTELPLPLPRPQARVELQNIFAAPPGSQRLVVQDASLALNAGQGLGIIGPSGSGKSSLVRLIVGVWSPARGKVRLDGAALEQWDPDALGEHIGYLPQDVELFAGNVAENISRFDPEAKPEAVLAAARAAGVHDLILALPEGYQTAIGEGGVALSAGQRQRIALARALYGDPFLVVLDEPNSNLDQAGEEALTAAIEGVRARGGIVIVVAHRPSALASVDMLAAMAEGRIVAFGPRDEVIAKVLKPQAVPTATSARGTWAAPASPAPLRPMRTVNAAPHAGP